MLVTGASSGIGRKVTERLAKSDYFVYAGARRSRDLHELGAIDNVQPLRLDVTSQEDIQNAARMVNDGEFGLYGLVNNAGVLAFGTAIDTSDAEFDSVMMVNVYGPYRMTKAFAPLITSEKGRIVMISSMAGILADQKFCAYSMSKHALEALTDCLALQLEALGVGVSAVEPGVFRTAICENTAKRVGFNFPMPDLSAFEEPDDVATAVETALSSPKPQRRYLVVSNRDQAEATIRRQFTQLVQLNEKHRYTYSRAELVKILDETLTCKTSL